MSKRLKGMNRYTSLGNLVLDGDQQDAGYDPEIATALDAPTAEKIATALEHFDGGAAERGKTMSTPLTLSQAKQRFIYEKKDN